MALPCLPVALRLNISRFEELKIATDKTRGAKKQKAENFFLFSETNEVELCCGILIDRSNKKESNCTHFACSMWKMYKVFLKK